MAWQRVAMVVAGAHAELLAEALEAEGALAVDIADDEAGATGESPVFGEPGSEPRLWKRCRISALFPAGTEAALAFDRALAESGAPALAAASIEHVEDADWVTRTQRQFAPMRVGARLWIVPTWHEAPDASAINIVLDPGAAFGTGSHPTTRLCLAWLERHVTAESAVLDYGCGSGVLGIAALRLGARAATGVDIDPQALEAASYNAQRNAVALKVVPATEALSIDADLTVANILANPLRMLAPLISAHTRVGGRIALSGVLEAQAEEVALAYSPWAALAVDGREEGWVLLSGTRTP
jgi:ribosomal protein L11 methyltransferase